MDTKPLGFRTLLEEGDCLSDIGAMVVLCLMAYGLDLGDCYVPVQAGQKSKRNILRSGMNT